ncbi:hypothetical protein A5886_001348 [Enterococcus sp. 8G7_MSG3316]|uniref:TPR repeat-containing protein n=1 Tax=Candidatus Enterococcus testudinis TaxID=1834191 RepID=A0A242A6B0_9ENTE|nr:hypothetical protein [Enterococcus sp. 8G7_MSG3316]OTN76271.1 hypothetical protein A5886_001348 [Enterococcus sp. 8G7_MSG3316]
MGETIDFPGPEQRLQLAAEKAYQAKEFLQAYRLYRELYTLEHTYAINQWLVECLQQLKEFSEALDTADDYLDDYLKDRDGFLQVGHLYVLDGQYLKAHRWLHLGHRQQVDTEMLQQLRFEIEKVEEVQQILGMEDHLAKKELLLNIDNLRQPVNYHSWQSLVQGMTSQQFIDLVRDLLPRMRNLYLIPKLVEELVRLDVHETFSVVDYMGETKTIDPSKLAVLPDMPVYQQIMARINDTIAQDDPILAESVIAEISDHLAISYPFLPPERQVNAWIDSYVADYRGENEQESQTKAKNSIQIRKERLRRILQETQF